MANELSLQTRTDLASNGIGIGELIGFDDHMMPMYLHLDRKGDKVLGDVFFKIRVGDPRNVPRSLDNSEAEYMNRKIRQMGCFPFPPGPDCLKREFTPWRDVDDGRGGSRRVKGTPTMGCKPCREREEVRLSGLTAGATDADESDDSTVSEEPSKTTADVVQPETTTCPICDYEPKQFRKTGRGEKKTTVKQRINSVRLHTNAKHK